MRKRSSLIILLILTAVVYSFATHNRAGEIIYRALGNSGLSYEATIITYTKISSPNADRDTLTIDWGDGTIEKLLRTNGPIGIDGVPEGENLDNDIKKNTYVGTHTYAGAAPFYLVSVTDPNRISSIININGGSSVNIQFYLEDTLRILDPTFVGLNNSPILLLPPIDFASINDTFYHNPIAYDPDGDSLDFQLIPPKQAQNFPVPNYQLPDEISPGIDNNFTINQFTGEVIWAVPKQEGTYNIAILITEFRNGIKMGTLLRDMQIIVGDFQNDPPRIANINDTCVIAGDTLAVTVNATDSDGGQDLRLTAAGGPLEFGANPATFRAMDSVGSSTGFFEWVTTCDDIRRQSYQVVFKAQDDFRAPGNSEPTPLVDLETWIIKVVAPPPENLIADAQGGEVLLNWDDPYACGAGFTDKFIGFSVWKREGSNPFVVDSCVTGLAGRGYTKIESSLLDFSYIDTDVIPGKNYCYRVLAEFAESSDFGLLYNKVESLPSNEACSELGRDIPVITNVTVDRTDTTLGEITVVWSKPLADATGLDTTQFPGPYVYRVMRTEGFGISSPNFVEVQTYTSPNFAGHNDTILKDVLLNTVDTPYTYQIEFYANTVDTVGESEPASSVYLSIGSSDNQLTLSWEHNVPWVNSEYVIYRSLDGIDGTYDSIGIALEQEYLDRDVVNDSLYCYYVRSVGAYSGTGFINPIINLSQRTCGVPIDTVAPCSPELSVSNACDDLQESEICAFDENDPLSPDNFLNNLEWSNPNNSCATDVRKYNVYYSSPFEDDYVLVDSVISAEDTTFEHILDESLAGCYAVTAIDTNGNESLFSNVVCVDNCPCYKLPNVFTPNGDGQNDLYTPIEPYRFVGQVDMKIFDRWGNLVFETTDPNIEWDGTDINNSDQVKDGVYYYTCTVFEIRINGLVKSDDILNGYIHVIHGNGESN